MLVLLALRTIGPSIQVVVQSHAAPARLRAGAPQILAQRPVHGQRIFRRRSYDDGVALPPVPSTSTALLRVVQQAEGMAHVDDQADVLLVQPERQGGGADHRTALRTIELPQHLVLVRQLRVVAQKSQLLRQVLDQVDAKRRDNLLRDARQERSYDAVKCHGKRRHFESCTGQLEVSSRDLLVVATRIRLGALVQLVSDQAGHARKALNIVSSENPASKYCRTTTTCCSTALDNLEKLFGLFVDPGRLTLVSLFWADMAQRT